MATKRIATDETIKIYRARNSYSLLRYYIAGFGLGIAGLSLVVYGIQMFRLSGYVSFAYLSLVIVFVVVTFVTVRSVKRKSYGVYLFLSDAGIGYRNGSRELHCPWNEVMRFIERPLPHLIVSTGGRSYGRYMMTKNPDDDPDIPLYMFAYSPNSELGKALRHYLPHLFS